VAKGYKGNKERLETISGFGKAISKRAGFACEWCGSKEDLRVWDHSPDTTPELETLALLCARCRDWADGRKATSDELRSIRNALWSCVPAVAEGAATVLAQCKESWVKDAIEESLIDETLKTVLLK
jgi:protein PhnA